MASVKSKPSALATRTPKTARHLLLIIVNEHDEEAAAPLAAVSGTVTILAEPRRG